MIVAPISLVKELLPVPPLLILIGWLTAGPATGSDLERQLGRNEIRIYSAPSYLHIGVSVTESALPQRLDRLGYRRVHSKPSQAGEYFWGYERFWLYRRAHDLGSRSHRAQLLGLELRGDGRLQRIFAVDREADRELERRRLWVEPELLAESFEGSRAPRQPVRLADLPEYVWRAVLAIEDHRFFEHQGVDARAIARALLRNALAGKVTQGGSTITQQLVKVRDLKPKRTLGRKVSEAVRALALEAEHDKQEILTAYLNSVYMGHVGGISVYGFGAAAQAYFSKRAERLGLGEAALLAGIIQGPNRLHPGRHPARALERQRVVLQRLEKLKWVPRQEIKRARRAGLPPLAFRSPRPRVSGQLLAWLQEIAAARAPRRLAEERGLLVETSLDAYLQGRAEKAVQEGLSRLRYRVGGHSLSAALVALDSRTGGVLAFVPGDPAATGDAFDRVRRARRQPGSAVKPFLLLEAFEDCGRRAPLYPSRRVSDRPLTLDLATGPWSPRNPDGSFRDSVDLRRAIADSLNVPLVRAARWCGFEATAARFQAAGLSLPVEPPPSFVLGSVETTPLELASAYTVFSTLGWRREPLLVERLEKPSGRRLSRGRRSSRRVVRSAAAYLARDLLRGSMEAGTASAARLPGVGAFGKTGTSSDRRDAWFAGGGGSIVAVVWVGRDDGSPLGLTGSQAAAPIWKEFMESAVPARPAVDRQRPRSVVTRWVDSQTGLVVDSQRPGARQEIFRRSNEPPRHSRRLGPRSVQPIE